MLVDSRGTIIMTVYVDDLIVTASSDELFVWFETELAKYYEYTNQGEVRYCLGVEFVKSEDGKRLTLIQRKYVKEILERFDFKGKKPVKLQWILNLNFLLKIVQRKLILFCRKSIELNSC